MKFVIFILFTLILILEYSLSSVIERNQFHFDSNSFEVLTRHSRQAYIPRQQERQSVQERNCSSREFKCRHGYPVCISRRRVCDGVSDCFDGSDETYLECSDYPCEDYAFRCKYGACIDKDKLCNGQQDCLDNSDETYKGCAQISEDTCNRKQFTCKNGECISKFSVCDGKVDCGDRSDETSETCQSNQCEIGIHFRCNYGACVDGDAQCDDKMDCADGSDENEQFCRFAVKPPGESDIVTEGCVLPVRPRFGNYKSSKGRGSEGQLVPIGSYLTFSCNTGYVLRGGPSILLCKDNTEWSANPPSCLVECPKLTSISLNITYSVGEGEPLIPGTVASLKCKDAYQTPTNTLYRDVKCLKSGQWNQQIYPCIPKCGIEYTRIKTLIVNGQNANASDFPWNVALYRTNARYGEDHQHICGGTIVSERLILTAAHCVFDNNYKGRNPNSKYAIGAGKFYREWSTNTTMDPYQQLREVHEVILPGEYQGVANSHITDIAYLVLKKSEPLLFNNLVRPACIDWNSESIDSAFKKGSFGTVVGWGLTAPSGNRSDVLKKVSIPFIPTHPDCFNSVPEPVKRYLLHDKVCAGLKNGSAVCEGDSGSGLMFKNPANELWYIRAIVSFSPSEQGSCDPYSYTAFTNIAFHMNWIKQYFYDTV